MSVKSGQAVTVLFTTQTPSTGAATDADSLPTGLLYVNGTVNGAAVTITNIATGVYKAAVALPSLTAGDMVSLRISATVALVPGEDCVWQDVSDTKIVSDLQDLTAAQVNAQCDTALSDYDPPTKAELDTGLAALNDITAANVWAYATRTLTTAAATVDAAVQGGTITLRRGDTLSASLTALGNISARTKLWFTVKTLKSLADSAALIQIEETAGLVYLNAAAGTSGNGSITVTDETAGNITIGLEAVETAKLAEWPHSYFYDVQMLTSGGVTTLCAGSLDVTLDVTVAIA